MTDGEKMKFMVECLEGGNQSEFARKLGVDSSVITRIKSGELLLRSRIDLIKKAYPIVNAMWLSGQDDYPGDLNVDLVKQRMGRMIEERDKIIATLTKEMELMQRVVEEKL